MMLMKVTFEEQERRLKALKDMCEEFPDDSVEEIQSKVIRVGYRFNHATVRHYLDLQKSDRSVLKNSFHKIRPYSDNEMDYGTTDLSHIKFEDLSSEEIAFYNSNLE